MTESKRSNVFSIGFDGFAGLSEAANADLSRLVISASRPLHHSGLRDGKIVFINDLTNIALSKIWEQLLRQKAGNGYFRLSMHDVTNHGAVVSALVFAECRITEAELTPLDQTLPESQRIEVFYSYVLNDVSLIRFESS